MSHTSEFLTQHPFGETAFLLERARSGSDAAWREILRRYHRMLEFHVRANIHGISRPDLEDLLQTVLSKVVTHIQAFEYRGEGSFRKWLAALVVNASINEVKLRCTSRALVRTDGCELTEVEDQATARSEELSAELRALLEMLGTLDPDDRDLLIMRYFEEMSWEGVAEVTQCSVDKVKKDYERAFQRLQRRMEA